MESVDSLGSALLLPLLPGEGRGEVIERLSSPPFRQRRKSLWQLLRRCRALRAHCSSPHLRPLLEGEESGEDTAPHRKSTVPPAGEGIGVSLPPPHLHAKRGLPISIPMEPLLRTRPTTKTSRPRWRRCRSSCRRSSKARWRLRYRTRNRDRYRNRANPLPHPPPHGDCRFSRIGALAPSPSRRGRG